MTIVRRPSPFGELMTLRQAVDRLFDDDTFRPMRWGTGSFDGPAVPLDVTTDTDTLVVEAALPGIKPEDVDITVENGTLTITGKTADERKAEEGSYLVQEIRRGTFSRSVSLPQGLEPDKAEATFENGTLTITGKTADERKAEEGSYLVQEIRRGTFSRSVTLPQGLEPDKAEATFDNGVLTLRIPKAEQVKPKQIRISSISNGNGHRTDDRPAVETGR